MIPDAGSKHMEVVHLTPGAAATHPYNLQLAKHLRALGANVRTTRAKAFLLEVLRFHPHVLHIHWLHPFVQTQQDRSSWLFSFLCMVALISQLVIVRARGIKIVWTVHELEIPESHHPDLDKMCIQAITSLSHAIITHCANAQGQVIDDYCNTSSGKVKVVPHGNFIETMENQVKRSEAREFLNIPESAFVVLFFGWIRPYKGVIELIEAHKQLRREDVLLLIAGRPLKNKQCVDYLAAVERSICGQRNIRIVLTYIRDQEVQMYMNASDVVAFPYQSIMTSGAVIAAMGFAKPCIASRLGCVGETLDDKGAFLYEPGDKTGLLTALKSCLQGTARLPAMGEHNRQLAESMNWPRIAMLTLDVYENCYAGKPV